MRLRTLQKSFLSKKIRSQRKMAEIDPKFGRMFPMIKGTKNNFAKFFQWLRRECSLQYEKFRIQKLQ